MLLTGCGERQMGSRVIAQNDEFCVTGDSVITHDITVWAVSPQEIVNELSLGDAERMLQKMSGSDTVPYCLTVTTRNNHGLGENGQYPRYQSQQTLVDALYNLALDDIAASRSRNGGFNHELSNNSLYTSIYLSLALLDPNRAMATLSNQVSEGMAMQPGDTWPVYDDRLGWPIAAWEVYCVTGDKQWLRDAFQVSLCTLDEELAVLYDPQSGLLRSGTLSQHLENSCYFPDWTTPIDLAGIETMLTNVMAMRALEVTNEMADELGVDIPYEQETAHLRERINQTLWNESQGRYSAYLLGHIAPTQVPLTDNLAQAWAVLWDLADDDRSTTLVRNTPISHRGVLPLYPSPQTIEPHLEYASWPLVQACWNLASATVDNEHALRRGLAALYRAQALYQTHHLSIEGMPSSGLAGAAGNVAMIVRVMAGMRFTPDGIEFSPFVPSCFPGNKNILNLAYRDATFDITLVGTGNDIETMTLDGQSVEGGYVAGNISGHHNILIKLKQGKTPSHQVTLASDARLPDIPQVRWHRDSGYVTGWSSTKGIKLAINGVRSYSVSDSAFRLPPLGGTSELTLVATNRHGCGIPSRPYFWCETPPVETVINDTLLLSDTLQVQVRADRAGCHLFWAEYGIDKGCDIMLVEANGHSQGAIILPAVGVSGHQQSNPIGVQLLRGDNVLTLRRYRIGYCATLFRLAFHPVP